MNIVLSTYGDPGLGCTSVLSLDGINNPSPAAGGIGIFIFNGFHFMRKALVLYGDSDPA